MTTKELTCAQMIADKLKECQKDISQILKDPNSDEFFNAPLSIDTKKFTTICLSYGGPADYIEIKWDDNGIESVIYRYSEWFDTATISVPENSPIWQYAQYIVDMENEG